MKKLMTVLLLFICLGASAQWTCKEVSNPFDGSFKKAWTEKNNYGQLVLQIDDTDLVLFVTGIYFCDDITDVKFAFVVGEKTKVYTWYGIRSNDGLLYYFGSKIWTENFIFDFKNAESCFVLVNQEYCQDVYYEFDFGNSGRAYEWFFE